METKQLTFDDADLKFNDDEWKVTGYGSVFNSVDKVGDTIVKGAFAESIASNLPRMHHEHVRMITPGMWTKAIEDDHGLMLEGYLTRGHSWAKDLRASLRHGTVRGLSIGFTLPAGGYEETDEGRTLKKIDLFEVSFTGNPAEPKAQVESWKSEIAALESMSDFEAYLRDAGLFFSRSMAKAFTSQFKASVLREAGELMDEKDNAIRAAKQVELNRMMRRSVNIQKIVEANNGR